MSIGNFIDDSICLVANGRYESAMSLAMNALDATANREYPGLGVRCRCERFLNDQKDIVTAVGFAGAVCAEPGAKLMLPNPVTGAPTSVEGILYEFVRCFLTHEAMLPAGASFDAQNRYRKTAEECLIPVTMIFGVIFAVVGAKSNAGEALKDADMVIQLRDIRLRIADCWGDKAKIRSLLKMPPAPEKST